jgi:hypothetical protein
MLAHKSQDPRLADDRYRKQLEYLYARRTSVDALIESLQRYDRFQDRRQPHQKRTSA